MLKMTDLFVVAWHFAVKVQHHSFLFQRLEHGVVGLI